MEKQIKVQDVIREMARQGRQEQLAQLGARALEILRMSYGRAYDERDASQGPRWAASPLRGPYEFLIKEAARSLGLLDEEGGRS